MFGKGSHHTEETKRIIRQKLTGRIRSVEHCRNISLAKLGKSIPALKGRIFSDQHRANLSRSMTGRPAWNRSLEPRIFQRKDGYLMLRIPGKGKRLLHRVIVEGYIGRKLLPNEVIHHLNGDRSDNRKENLYIFIGNGAHLKAEFSSTSILTSNLNLLKKSST